jgi:hypothetical protein
LAVSAAIEANRSEMKKGGLVTKSPFHPCSLAVRS